MDRHRGDRYGGGGGGYQDVPRYSRGSSRYSSDGPPMTHHQPRRGSSPSSFRVSVDTRSFESPPSHGHRGGGSYRPIGIHDDRYGPRDGDSRGYEHNYDESPFVSGQKRGYSRGRLSPDHSEGATFAKLFVGSVPSYVTENDIRPLFEEHGNVIEVALIKDRKTGQQRGCCFIKYSTSEEADRAIRALHNQYTLPGGVGPIQVRYADGERERLGAVEYKLFVGSLNKQATEQEVEEIFAPYGRVEDVYLMRNETRQSRGCGFVKFAHKDVAWAAINALNGIYTMRGCDQPLTVRFADPKRPRLGDSRGGTALGGPGPDPQYQFPGGRQPPNFNEPSGDRARPSAWNHTGVQDQGLSNASNHDYANPYPRGSDMVAPPNPNPPMRAHGGSTDGHPPAPMAQPSTFPAQSVNMPFQHFHPVNQQISPSQKPLQSPQQQLPPHVPPPLHSALSYSQTQTSHTQFGPSGSLPNPTFTAPFTQAMPTQPMMRPGAQSAPSSATTLQAPAIINLQSQPRPNLPNQAEQFFPPTQPQQIPQPPHQSPSPLAQMLNQQTQTLRASFQSSQQTFSQLQQQVQMMQPSNQSVAPHQQGAQLVNQQWPKNVAQTGSNNSLAVPSGQVASSSSAPASAVPGTTATAGPVKSNWTEHTSPDGFKYYYNNSTGESSWVEPEELKIYKQHHQPQQQKPAVQQSQVLNQPYQQYLSAQNQQPQLQSQPQMHLPQQPLQAQPQTPFSQQPLQAQPQAQFSQQPLPAQPQLQFSRQPLQAQSQAHFPQQPLQQPSLNSPYQAPGAPPSRQNVQELSYPQYQGVSGSHPSNDPGLFQQGVPASQEWMWKNKQPTAPEELS